MPDGADVRIAHLSPQITVEREDSSVTVQQPDNAVSIGGPVNVTGLSSLNNIGGGAGLVFRDIMSGVANLRTLVGAGETSVATVGDTIEISTVANVVGPEQSVQNNSVARFDGPTGRFIKSTVGGPNLNDAGDLSGVGLINGVQIEDHSDRHEDGGDDEIDVGGLSGLLADPQIPLAHAVLHTSGAPDEINAANLGSGSALGDRALFSDGAGGNVYAVPFDELVGVTGADTTPGHLADKIVAGLGISKAVVNPGADEELRINVVGFTETDGPTALVYGAVADGFLLGRNGATVIGIDPDTVGLSDHGAFDGLLEDDHPQYLRLGGRGAPQNAELDGGALIEVGRLEVGGRAEIAGYMTHSPVQLSQLTADVAALALPAGSAGRFVLLQDSDGSGPHKIMGIVPLQDGDTFYMLNNGPDQWDFSPEDALAVAAHRIITPNDKRWKIATRKFAKLWYDSIATRWRVLESNGA